MINFFILHMQTLFINTSTQISKSKFGSIKCHVWRPPPFNNTVHSTPTSGGLPNRLEWLKGRSIIFLCYVGFVVNAKQALLFLSMYIRCCHSGPQRDRSPEICFRDEWDDLSQSNFDSTKYHVWRPPLFNNTVH